MEDAALVQRRAHADTSHVMREKAEVRQGVPAAKERVRDDTDERTNNHHERNSDGGAHEFRDHDRPRMRERRHSRIHREERHVPTDQESKQTTERQDLVVDEPYEREGPQNGTPQREYVVGRADSERSW